MPDPVPVLLADRRVAAARRRLEEREAATLAFQAELSAIAAPTGAESARAARVAQAMRAAGLAVRMDTAGNVRARLRNGGTREREADAPVIVAAHLDTVFAPDVDVAVRRHGARLMGPGISDNARGLAALVAAAEALAATGIETRLPIWFVATVGEEGAGNLRGVRHLLTGESGSGNGDDALPRPAAFIALDGAGLTRVAHRALGSRRYRVTYRGPGGHSWAAFGVANPATAVGRAAAALAHLPLPAPPAPRTTCAVVGLGGGTGLNSIPRDAWLELDLRSVAPDALAALDRQVHAALATARDAENDRRTPGTPALDLEVHCLGERPSGVTPRSHPLVAAALAVTRALGADPELAAASTDANVPIAQGIPAIALGAGGRAGDVHLPTEWYEDERGVEGIVRALLVTVAMAERV